MRLRRCLTLLALLALLGSPVAYANPAPEPEDPPISTRKVVEPSRPGTEPRFETTTSVGTVVLAADGSTPTPTPTATRRPDPGTPQPPSEPDAGPENSGGIAKIVPQSRSTVVPAMSLVDVPGWVRAGGGAIEFRFTITNETGRAFDEMHPQLVFTAGDIDLVPDSLKVETRDMSGSRWTAVPFTVLVDPADGRGTHLLGSLTQTSWDDHPRLAVDEITGISVRVSFPAGSAAVGHDIAVLGATGYQGGVERHLVSRSDFRVFTVTASGSPAKAPTLRPEPPALGPAPAEADSPGARGPDRASDPFTWATIAIWVALAGVAGLVGWFAVKNRREGAGTRPGPDA